MTLKTPIPGLRARPAKEADLPAIREIYRHHVVTGLGTFEEKPPDMKTMEVRWREVTERRLPYLVAEDEVAVRGYAYATPYRTRTAYRYTVEDSIYVSPAFARRGAGRLLLLQLIETCTAAGYRQMVAVIGDSGNTASIRLHEKLGFERVGILPSVGYKFDRWVDCILMQRAIGESDRTRPAIPG